MALTEVEGLIGGPPILREPDGRTARRNRNQEAVVDALLDLLAEGNLEPSSEQIAERAGLSPRSLFRYFADTDELRREAVSRQRERIGPLIHFTVDLHRPFNDRVIALANQRITLFDAMGMVGVWARMKEPLQPEIARRLGELRTLLKNQVIATVTPELEALDATLTESLLMSADLLASFEAYHYLRTLSKATADEWRHSLVTSFEALFSRR